MRKTLLVTLTTLCTSPLVPTQARAQSSFYIRMLPEVSVVSAEHTKQVTTADGFSSNSSSALTPEGGINFYVGYLSPSEGWAIGGELRGAISLRPTIEDRISRAGTGTHAVWPGPWEIANRVGMGANLLAGRNLGFINGRGFLFAGIARWNTDFRSAGDDPASEELIDDTRQTGRWPLTAGLGVTLPFERPLDIRLRYFRSVTSWSVDHDVNQKSLTFDYTFSVQGLALSLGLGTR